MNSRLFHLILNVVLICALVVPSVAAQPRSAHAVSEEPTAIEFHLYRTQVEIRNDADRARLQKLGVITLEEEEDAAFLIVASDQLEDLARLNFHPRHTEELGYMLYAGAAPEWLRNSMHSLLAEAMALDMEMAAQDVTSSVALVRRSEIGNMLYGLTAEQKLGMAKLDTVDTDEDGLTDTEEGWWCTDAADPDSDDDGVEDGQEISQLMEGNKTNGKPFQGWPTDIPGCFDDDFDSMPDLAETNVVGLSVNRESSDLDKYDDGQEFFGNTYCPGVPGSCGYGALPRTEDLYLGSNMPSWVEAPANSPFVAAFPDPIVSIVDDSLNVESVTAITTDHTIGEGESHTYSTATTKGTSTSNVDLVTWNEWMDIDTANPMTETLESVSSMLHRYTETDEFSLKEWFETDFVAFIEGYEQVIADKCLSYQVVGCIRGLKSHTYQSAFSMGELYRSEDILNQLGIDPDDIPELQKDVCTHQAAMPGFKFGCDSSFEGFYDGYMDNSIETQDHPTSEEGTNLVQNQPDQADIHRTHEGEVALGQIDLSSLEPVTHAVENGGIRGTITTEYSETTITEAQEFSTFESWSEATAVNSAHAADLRFTYAILNDGTDILRELDELLFNIYLGDNPSPIYTYNAIADTGPISNKNPGAGIPDITSQPIPLTLQQMKAIDQGANIYITVEHLAYGGDQVFFEDAVNGGLIVGVEDGWADGDDVLDLYILPCFGNPCGSDPNETVQAIVKRGFPNEEDPNGNLLSITTPEVDGSVVDWVEHRLDYTSWWNFYLSDNIDYTGAFSTTMPLAGEAVVMRFLDDSDLDGYNDRTEIRLGTDPNDAGSHPKPELLAGAVSKRTGDDVKVTMAFLNTGPYDATGVEVVAYAPNDTITMGDNTIGGSGRVSSGHRVVLGGRVKDPRIDNWTGTATPMSSGMFEGSADTTYTFTAQGSGDIGTGNILIDWTDGVNSGSLQVGDGYLSPLPIDVGDLDVKVAFNTGSVVTGESFTIDAQPPGDTITYSINSEPYMPPVLVVSYNDPQGNHRFITPITITTVSDDLSVYSGEMIEDLELSITTIAEFDEAGTNATYYITNSPDETPLEDAHLFVEYINDEGHVVAEQVFTDTIQPGPTVWQVDWDTSMFTETFSTAEDYIILALWTDGQGDIIDTSVRPLSSFQEDPLPEAANSDLSWDFGNVYVSEPVYQEFVVGNVGQNNLPAMVVTDIVSGTVLGDWRVKHPPTESSSFGLQIDTSSPGAINGDITIRTSDLDEQEIVIPVTGNILPLPNLFITSDDISFSNDYPSDGEPVTISVVVHNEGPDPVHNVIVRFSEGEPLADAPQIGDDQIIVEIPSNGQALAQIQLNYNQGHNHFHVSLDPEDFVPETDEHDNNDRWFTNIQPSLPPDGVLNDGEVYHITDPAELTNTIVVTDSATLIMEGISGVVESVSVGAGATVLLRTVELDVTDLIGSEVISSTVFSLAGGSAITVTHPYTLSAFLIEIQDSVMTSIGEEGIVGTPGLPGGMAFHSANFHSFNSELMAKGGQGGSGAQRDPPGNGAEGGDSWLNLATSAVSAVMNSSFTVSSGAGGTGGGSWEVPAGRGGPSGVASSTLEGEHFEFHKTVLNIEAGHGGDGGSSGNHGGGSGGAGSAASLSLEPDSIIITESQFRAIGGLGGLGKNSGHEGDGGHGAAGGNASVELLANDIESNDLSLEVIGGEGGSGGNDGGVPFVSGGSGGSGGSSTLNITGTTLYGSSLQASSIGAAGGNGGDGNFGGGNGGEGGIAYATIDVDSLLLNLTSKISIGGQGGNGGDSRNEYGGFGGHGGNATSTANASNFVTDSMSNSVISGAGGIGGDSGDDNEDRGGNGGNGGSILFDWSISSSWTPNTEYWEFIPGVGGAPGTAWINGAAGSDGEKAMYISEGYESHSPGGDLIEVETIRPNLLTVEDIDFLEMRWNSGITQTIEAPYRTTIPNAPSFNDLHLHYAYTDSTAADSTHSFYVHGSGDYDGDSLNDVDETNIHDTDPVFPDTDDDGLNDGDEIVVQTDPNNPDSDYDGILDGEDPEVLYDPELSPEVGSPIFGDPNPTEDDLITLSSVVSNNGSNIAEGIVVAFYDGIPDNGGLYICSDFIVDLEITDSENAECVWDTSGRTGSHEIYVVVDPNNHIVEENEDNNSANASLYIKAKPDLAIDSIDPSAPEVLAGETIGFSSVISNTGETDAGSHEIDFLENDVLFGSDTLMISAESSDVAESTWTPSVLGPHTITVKADTDDVIVESDETNNEMEISAYVGFAGFIELDSGGDSSADPAYTSESGYGYLNGSAITFCGSEPEQSQRSDGAGAVEYRFDHLLPSHRYHLDIILYECDGLGRQEQVLVDGNLVSGVEDLSDGQIHELSFLLDPVMYDDHSIIVRVEELIGYDALVSQISLHNIDYRYIDAGGGDDPEYSPEVDYGWLDGVAQSPWGDEPYKSRRIDLGDSDPSDDPDNELRYQFDNLDPSSNYELHLTFYQGAGGLVQQSIALDDIDTGITVELDGEQRVDQTVFIPKWAYADDGTIVLRITRTNSIAGAFVNELVLEQVTSGVPLAVTDTTLLEDSGEVRLEWTDVGRGVEFYEVWRSQSPYFTPGAGSAERITANVPANPGGIVTYTDATSHLGDPATNDYYLILAVKSGRISDLSNHASAFDFGFTPGL